MQAYELRWIHRLDQVEDLLLRRLGHLAVGQGRSFLGQNRAADVGRENDGRVLKVDFATVRVGQVACTRTWSERGREGAQSVAGRKLRTEWHRPQDARVFSGVLTFVQDLQENVRDVLVRLFELVKQDDGIRPPANLLRELAGLLKSDEPRCRADEPRNGVLVLVLAPARPERASEQS